MKYISVLLSVFAAAVVDCYFYPFLGSEVCEFSHYEKQQFSACFERALYDIHPQQREYYRHLQNCMREVYRLNDDAYFIHYSECSRDQTVGEALLNCAGERVNRDDITRYWNHLIYASTKCTRSVRREE